MLILTRRVDEVIYIDSCKIKIMVVSIDNGSVRIGIEAPPEISILRAELVDSE